MLQQSLFTDYPSLIRRSAVVVVVLLLLGVVGSRVLTILTPPPLTIDRPADLLSTSSRFVTIAGKTEPGVALTINGVAFVPDAAGAFSTDIILTPGANTIDIEARRRHSRPARVTRRVQVLAASAPVA